ncbi:MAG: (2Fe-2S)-binding protein [Acidimicrobiia bacterium]|nr:(2Fe-2S)-binding protein [Acidimicrobiia bacterium]
MKVTFTVNGVERHAESPPGASLMDVLRGMGLTSVKNGCDNGDCGSCAVLLNGRAVNACLVFAARCEGAEIGTLEGMAAEGALHALQAAMLASGAVQCGFCTPGIVMMAADLLEHTPSPTNQQIDEAMAGNFCRCTGYTKPREAIRAAAEMLKEASGD